MILHNFKPISRTSTYLFLAVTIFFFTIAFPLFNPDQRWYFIIEESVGFAIVFIGFILFRKKVSNLVAWFDKTIPFKKDFQQRVLKEIALVLLLSLALSATAMAGLALFFNYYGEPAYYVKKEQIKKEINAQNIENEGRKRHRLQPFSTFVFLNSVLGSSFFLFGMLFSLEEAFNFNNRRQQHLLNKEQLAKEQALTKANALKKQLNPHFMFNTLNVLAGLMHEDLDKADEFIKKLSQIYRYFLEQSEEVVATVEKELAFIESYIFLQKIRFEDKLQTQYNIPQNRLDWLLPSLTLELLVENAIKHNIITPNNPLVIELLIVNDALIVKNNYQPRNDAKSAGYGIKNLQERLQLLGINKGKFEVQSGYFIATIPLLKPENYD